MASATVDSVSCASNGETSSETQPSAFPAFISNLRNVLATRWSRDSIDFLVNNAGSGRTAPFADTTEKLFDRMMNEHLKGVYFLTQALLPLIANSGRIVNLSSGVTRLSLPGYSAYAAMKGGIEVLTRALAKELGPRGIAVNTIAPGAIATDFGGGDVRDNPEFSKAIAAQTALGRVGVPDDVGPLIAALLSESGRWVNAQRIGRHASVGSGIAIPPSRGPMESI